jgi:hypothetical protein
MAQTSTKIAFICCHDPLLNEAERSMHVKVEDEAQQEGLSVSDAVLSEATRQCLGVRRAASMPIKGGLQILRCRRARTTWKKSRISHVLIMWLAISKESILKKPIYHSKSLTPSRHTCFGRKYQHVCRMSRKYLWLFFNIIPTSVKALRLGMSFCIWCHRTLPPAHTTT